MSRWFSWTNYFKVFDANWTANQIVSEYRCREKGIWSDEVLNDVGEARPEVVSPEVVAPVRCVDSEEEGNRRR
jgi:hypothetical protein